MVMSKLRSARLAYGMVALGVALVLSACGGSTSTSSAPATTTQAAVASSTASAAPKPRLKTLSPRAGSRIGANVTVRVALINGEATGPKPFRYVLDGQTRFGPRRLVFHGVKPGHHHLIVTLVEDRAVRSQTPFEVKASPPPIPVVSTPAPTPAAPTAPAPSTTAAPVPTPPAPTPPTTAAPAPAPPTMTSPPAGGGIPQGGGGDGDGDNSGGPSDGDGNI
jgi:hypothetical protein